MKRGNDGKAAEEFVREVFVRLQQKHEFFFIRLYDSTSAKGNPIPAQIADFVGTYKGSSLSLEVKSSIKYASLREAPRSYIRATQVAKGKLFARAGGFGFYIFVVPKTGKFEIYSSWEVCEWFYAENRRQKLACPLRTGKGKDDLYNKLIEVLR